MSDCWTVGVGNDSVYGTADGGSVWTPESLPAGDPILTDISCPTTSDCWTVGTDGSLINATVLATTDGGTTWSTQSVPPATESLTGVSCPTASACVAVGVGTSGPVVLSTTDGGASWSSEGLPKKLVDPNASLSSVACASASDCWAVGAGRRGLTGAVIRTTNGGRTWRNEALPKGIEELRHVSCVNPSDCWAVGSATLDGHGVVIATTDAGKTWNTQRLPKRVGALDDISCSGGRQCWITGASVDASGGARPSAMGVDATRLGRSGIVTAPGGAGLVLATSDGGKRWKSEGLPPGTSGPSGISCPDPSTCRAVATTTDDVVILAFGVSPPPVSSGVTHHRARLGPSRRR